MLTVIALGYLLIGIFLIFFQKGKYLVPYILFLNIYSAWITDLIFPLEQGDQRVFDGISKYYTYFCFVIFFFLKKKKGIDLSLLYAFGLTAIYFILIYTLRGTGPVVGLKFAISTFGSVMLFYVLLLHKPKKQMIRKIVKWNLIIQLVIGGFQFLGLFHFHMNVGATSVFTNYITGSFTGNNYYAEVLSLLMILLCTFDYKDKGSLDRSTFFFIGIVLTVVLFTGVRTALLADVIALVVLFYIYNKNKPFFKVRFLLLAAILGVIAFFLYQTANQDVMIVDRYAENPIERQLNGVRQMSDRDNLEVSTVGLSLILWNYFIESPIVGPGLFFASPAGYGWIISEDTANSTDATILFYMCETGLIGVLFFLWIYGLALKRYNKYKGAYITFIFIMLISITDAGFMGFAYIIYLYLSIYYDNYERFKYEKNSVNLLSQSKAGATGTAS